MRTNKNRQIAILKAIRDNSYTTSIGKALKANPSTITRYLQRMERNGYIRLDSYTSRKIYQLTETGLAFLLDNVAILPQSIEKAKPNGKPLQPVVANSKPLATQQLRIHSLAIAFELRTHLNPDEPQLILQSKGLMESKSGLKNQLSAYMQDGLLAYRH